MSAIATPLRSDLKKFDLSLSLKLRRAIALKSDITGGGFNCGFHNKHTENLVKTNISIGMNLAEFDGFRV